jgi:hypothetical protein
MKNKLLFLLLTAVALLLCACTETEESLQTTEERPVETTETATSATTVPPHSLLFHPDYTAEQILEYFGEVVLDMEYASGAGNTALVQKWQAPIRYRFFGTPTEEDRAVLAELFVQLNQIPGFPGIHEAAEGETEQLRISFLEPDLFRASYSDILGGEEATGATQFWYYTDTNEIHSARIGYRTDIAQNIRNSVLIEEIINTLGISDTVLREDSITYQYSDDNTALSEVDRILLALLYHPDIRCGMDGEACASVIRNLYY